MQGFFYQQDPKAIPKKEASRQAATSPRTSSLKKTTGACLGIENACEVCGLYKTVKSPKMGITGQGRLNILYMAEAQGINEDEQGRQLVGDAGQVLRGELAKCGVDFDQDFYALNAVRCFTWKDGKKGRVSRNPTDQEIRYCWKGTWDLVRELKPKAIILAGLVPLQSYLLDKGQDKPTMARWRSWAIPDQDLGCWVIPNYHPSYILRNSHNKALANLFWKDLRKAIEDSQKPFRHCESDKLLYLLSEDDAGYLLDRLLQEKVKDFLEIDFETTGLKPHRQGHDITHVGLCFGNEEAWSFRLTERLRPLLRRVLLDPAIPLAAHNVQMEQLWAWKILDAEIPEEKWYWDSMIAAHVLDNRSEITSLEFQAAVRYGDWFFKNATDPYLKCPGSVAEFDLKRKTGGNDFNRIHDCPEEEILKRVCKDALYGYWLANDQMEEMNRFPVNPMGRGLQISDAYWLFHNGTLAMGQSKISGGLVFDKEYFDVKKAEVAAEIEPLLAGILASRPAKVFKEQISNGIDLNPGSDDQMRKLMFDVYRIPPLAETETGMGKVDNEFLTSLVDNPVLGKFCQDVLRYNQLVKLKSTYIAGYERESLTFDGRSPYDPECKDRLLVLYPHLALNLVATYRSSSRDPNFQNIPNRSNFAREMIRGGLLPHPGHRFLSVDFGCFVGSTEIETINGKRRIDEIVSSFDKEPIYVYCYDLEKKRIAISFVEHGELTKKKVEVWKVVLDNGEEIIATPDHKFMLRDGSYLSLKNMSVGQSLMPLYKKRRRTDYGTVYEDVYLNDGRTMAVHNLVSEDVYGTVIKGSNYIVHHIDGNGCNNHPDNLMVVTRKTHMKIHSVQGHKRVPNNRRGWNDKQKTAEMRQLARERHRRRILNRTEEDIELFRQKVSDGMQRTGANKGEKNSMYGRKHKDSSKTLMSERKKGKLPSCCGWQEGLTKDTHPGLALSAQKRKGKEPWNKGLSLPPLSEKQKQKMSKALTGQKRSNETKKKISDKKKEYWKRWRDEKEKLSNHKVVKIEFYGYEDVYNITVANHHNFALGAGVIVKNSHEFVIAANYSRDREMIRYIVEGGDPHGDQADRLFFIPDGQRTKQLRYIGKNGWVFPQQYGSPAGYKDRDGHWRGCAPNMWSMAASRTLKDGTPLLEHLASKGIKTLDQFAQHCQAEEKIYWNKFAGLKAWQQEWISRYERDGVVPLYHGFVCQGLMTKNQILNYSIQGTGFHFLLESYVELLRISKEEGWRSRMIGQIHDEIKFSAHPDEFDYLVQLIEWVMVHMLAERHPEFLLVPLKAEFKAAGVDEPWSKEKGFEHAPIVG